MPGPNWLPYSITFLKCVPCIAPSLSSTYYTKHSGFFFIKFLVLFTEQILVEKINWFCLNNAFNELQIEYNTAYRVEGETITTQEKATHLSLENQLSVNNTV